MKKMIFYFCLSKLAKIADFNVSFQSLREENLVLRKQVLQLKQQV